MAEIWQSCIKVAEEIKSDWTLNNYDKWLFLLNFFKYMVIQRNDIRKKRLLFSI